MCCVRSWRSRASAPISRTGQMPLPVHLHPEGLTVVRTGASAASLPISRNQSQAEHATRRRAQSVTRRPKRAATHPSTVSRELIWSAARTCGSAPSPTSGDALLRGRPNAAVAPSG